LLIFFAILIGLGVGFIIELGNFSQKDLIDVTRAYNLCIEKSNSDKIYNFKTFQKGLSYEE